MTVVEPGPGMGFFTLELARRVGPRGRVVAIDIQAKMLDALVRRARRVGLAERIEVRKAKEEKLGIEDLASQVDFVLAFWVVHELPDLAAFLAQVHQALKPGGRMLISEPKIHVTQSELAETVAQAEHAGFSVEERPSIRASNSALLVRRGA
jgi:ubiquinone/menaquinone biosynthesis C-methylase UbiE